jgi:hypothetical protein
LPSWQTTPASKPYPIPLIITNDFAFALDKGDVYLISKYDNAFVFASVSPRTSTEPVSA